MSGKRRSPSTRERRNNRECHPNVIQSPKFMTLPTPRTPAASRSYSERSHFSQTSSRTAASRAKSG